MSRAHRDHYAEVVALRSVDAMYEAARERGDRAAMAQYEFHRDLIVTEALEGVEAATKAAENEEYWRNNPTCPPAVRSHMECPMCGEHAVQQHLFAVADAGAWACSECAAAGPSGTYWPLLRAKKGIK